MDGYPMLMITTEMVEDHTGRRPSESELEDIADRLGANYQELLLGIDLPIIADAVMGANFACGGVTGHFHREIVFNTPSSVPGEERPYSLLTNPKTEEGLLPQARYCGVTGVLRTPVTPRNLSEARNF